MAPLTRSKLGAALRVAAGTFALLCAGTGWTEPTDIAVKAAFLPRFARYVTWPHAALPGGSDAIILCVIGVDPFGTMLDEAARSQLVDGHPLSVRRMASATGAESCNIAFVQGTRAQPAGQVLAAIGARPVLTVTDASGGSAG